MTRLLLAAAVLAAAPCFVQAEAPEGNGPAWRTDYAKARAEARQARKLLFVVFRCQP